MGLPPTAEGDEPDENAKKVLDERVAPTKLIVLEMTDQEIIERIQQLPEEKIANTHLNDKRLGALLKRYRALHNSESGEYIL